jgi:hypothetical protein
MPSLEVSNKYVKINYSILISIIIVFLCFIQTLLCLIQNKFIAN